MKRKTFNKMLSFILALSMVCGQTQVVFAQGAFDGADIMDVVEESIVVDEMETTSFNGTLDGTDDGNDVSGNWTQNQVQATQMKLVANTKYEMAAWDAEESESIYILPVGESTTVRFVPEMEPVNTTNQTVVYELNATALPEADIDNADLIESVVFDVEEGVIEIDKNTVPGRYTVKATTSDGSNISAKTSLWILPEIKSVKIDPTVIYTNWRCYKALETKIEFVDYAGAGWNSENTRTAAKYAGFSLKWNTSTPNLLAFTPVGEKGLFEQKVIGLVAGNAKLNITSTYSKKLKQDADVQVKSVVEKVYVFQENVTTVPGKSFNVSVEVLPQLVSSNCVNWILTRKEYNGGIEEVVIVDKELYSVVVKNGKLKFTAHKGLPVGTYELNGIPSWINSEVYLGTDTTGASLYDSTFSKEYGYDEICRLEYALVTKSIEISVLGMARDIVVDYNGEILEKNVLEYKGFVNSEVPLSATADNGSDVRWTSSNNKIISIDEETNTIVVKNKGTVKLTASTMDGSGFKETITVKVNTVPTALCPKDNYIYYVERGKTLTPKVYYEPEKVSCNKLLWSLSYENGEYNEDAVQLNSKTGVFKTSKNATCGTYIITAVSQDNPKAMTDFTVHVVDEKLVGLEIVKLNDAYTEGDSILSGEEETVKELTVDLRTTRYIYLAAKMCYDNNSENNGKIAYANWKSNNKNVEVYNDGSGCVRVKMMDYRTKSVVLTATATDGSKKSAKLKINCCYSPIQIDVDVPNAMAVGKSIQAHAEFYHTASDQRVVWDLIAADSEEMIDFATINSRGKITLTKEALKDSETVGKQFRVRATSTTFPIETDEKTVGISQVITVINPMGKIVLRMGSELRPKDEISQDKKNYTIYTAEPTQGESQSIWVYVEVDGKLIYAKCKTDNKKIKVSHWSSGEISMDIPDDYVGKISISATLQDGSKRTVKGYIEVRRPVTSLEIDNSTTYLAKGKSVNLKPIFNNGETPTNSKVMWESSNPSIATVNEKGKVKALKCGKVTITCTSEENPDIRVALDMYIGASKLPVRLTRLKIDGKNYCNDEEMGSAYLQTVARDGITAKKGDRITIKAAECFHFGYYENATTWKYSLGKNLASYDYENKDLSITCISPGKYTLTATTQTGQRLKIKLTIVE